MYIYPHQVISFNNSTVLVLVLLIGGNKWVNVTLTDTTIYSWWGITSDSTGTRLAAVAEDGSYGFRGKIYVSTSG